jgi:predicted subunit of tRNA(5-methylaminomethyl-2-thiouridylate) methyltransferase
MKAGVLYSGGKDSSLAAIMLGTYYEVELNVFVFDPSRNVHSVEAGAHALGYPLKIRTFGKGLLDDMARTVIRCGHPSDAINAIHRSALEYLCGEYRVVGDGTRFDDRVPMLTRSEALSLCDRTGCSYVRPLLGFARAEINRLAERLLTVEYGETGIIRNGDYEAELRAAVRAKGHDPAALFPAHHDQSLVVGKRG